MPLAFTFKALSDPTRREILNLLRERPLPAGEIAAHFSMTGATVSHHLAILREAGLISDRHEGKFIYYELDLSVFEDVLNWFQQFLNKKEESDHEI
ncbi:ArsR family transcriptional regulator [Caproiciproducens sp. NJN-50]|uniref:autorepressor SdpR family transcription factor n=1 Tax=Acutalibacteraceae TaxID=3082771 RepID=UPI000FFE243E|nr:MULTISPECIES: autorepressor SdpR family transcription factor [Acutalibacteraceae]QAT49238.1 ArsR family transcriptional regulator [Caproiciproducens sp. NJN-50]